MKTQSYAQGEFGSWGARDVEFSGGQLIGMGQQDSVLSVVDLGEMRDPVPSELEDRIFQLALVSLQSWYRRR